MAGVADDVHEKELEAYMSTQKKTFWRWLKEQGERNDAVGDLATDALHDSAHKGGTLKWWTKHLHEHDASPDAKNALQDAWAEYTRGRR